MEWKQAPKELTDFLLEKMKGKNCDYKKMFGYPAFFINGNMFAGVHGDHLFLRLPDSEIANLMKNCKDVAAFEPRAGRAWNGYVVLPKSVYSNEAVFAGLLDNSMQYVSGLPPKKAKK